MPKRIFIGFNNAAGYGTRLVTAFRQIGVNADLYVEGRHPFGFENETTKYYSLPKSRWLQRIYTRLFFLKCLFKYDAFLFISIQTFIKGFKDLKILRKLNKKTLMIFVGCDVQQPELTHKPGIPYSSCHNCVQEYKDFVGCVPETKPARTRKIEGLIDYIMTDRALADSVHREFFHINQPININDFPVNIKETGNTLPVILHAPSNFGYKGTKYLVEAIEKLKTEFKFEFKLVNNVTLKELYNEIERADLIVDQLIQGWFGMLPLEAIMFGKPVICYLRDDVVKALPGDCSIINANPGNIYSVLKECLQNKDKWKEIGVRGRDYVIKYHDSKIIAKRYADLLLT